MAVEVAPPAEPAGARAGKRGRDERALEAGDEVDAQWGHDSDELWFAGVVQRVRASGRVDVAHEDGDEEVRLQRLDYQPPAPPLTARAACARRGPSHTRAASCGTHPRGGPRGAGS